MTASKPKRKKSGQPKKAGRLLVRHRPQAQVIAFRLLRYGVCVLAVMLLVSSTISDNIQKLVQSSLAASQVEALSAGQTQARASLLRLVTADTDGVRGLTINDVMLLFGRPNLRREEGKVFTLQYLSSLCAMDVYFKQGRKRPAYVEYRLSDGTAGHAACVQSLFEQAKFGDVLLLKG